MLKQWHFSKLGAFVIKPYQNYCSTEIMRLEEIRPNRISTLSVKHFRYKSTPVIGILSIIYFNIANHHYKLI